MTSPTDRSSRAELVAANDLETVWRTCHAIRGSCERCPSAELVGGDECVRGCYAHATECVNVVQTGNPWRREKDVRPPWTVLTAAKAPQALTAPVRGDREAVARIIDGAAWEFADRHRANPAMRAEVLFETGASLRQADAILALSAPPSSVVVGELVGALEAAEDQFRFYDSQHRAKCTAEGDAKAEVNRKMADRMAAAISSVRASGGASPRQEGGDQP